MLALLVLAESAVAVDPVADFSISWTPNPPTRPLVGQTVSFNGEVSDWGGPPGTTGTVVWSFGDGTGQLNAPLDVSHSYSGFGAMFVTMTVINQMGDTTAVTKPVNVDASPVAAFTFGPLSPVAGQDVQFASESEDADGLITQYLWDFGDGVTATSRSPTHPFATPGAKNVRLTVADAFGATSTVTHVVDVGTPVTANAPPTGSFAFSPRRPRVGQQVEFVSTAVDPEDQLQSQRWDLDGDGQFDDAQGERVLETYTTAGAKTVRLRVEDAAGGAAVRERVVTVQPGEQARAGFLNPFPVVRITGAVLSFGTDVELLSVRAPKGAFVRARCQGERCPTKVARRRVGKSRRVRLKAFERLLPAGIKIEVFVRKPGKIGKYTSFKIRRGVAPKRADRCLMPGRTRPARCPS